MATVYSYCRFSARQQEQGDSIRRQIAMRDAWMMRHPEHTLDTVVSLRDLGVSAFRGKNLDPETGDLGKFLALVRGGKIGQGSILLIERLDRFSRLPPSKSIRALTELVESGVSIQTLDPEQLITHSNVDDMEIWLPINIYLQIAHQQSKEKRHRVGQVWIEKRKKAQQGVAMTARCPAWLEFADGKYRVKKGAAKAVRYIFQRTIEGCGQRGLTAELNEKFPTIGRGKKWLFGYVQKILADRTTLGELQLHAFDVKGERLPEGEPIQNYYPAVVDADVWHLAQAAKAKRICAKGPNGKFVNTLVGLIKCCDGYPMHIAVSRAKRNDGTTYLQRRLWSAGRNNGLRPACRISVDYYDVERSVFNWVLELQPSDLSTADADTSSLTALEAELTAVTGRMSELEKSLVNTKKPLAAILTALNELGTQQERLKHDLDQLRQSKSVQASRPLVEAQGVLDAIDAAPEAERHDLRLRLRGLVTNLVESIEITPRKLPNRRTAAQLRIITATEVAVVDTETVRYLEDMRVVSDEFATAPDEFIVVSSIGSK